MELKQRNRQFCYSGSCNTSMKSSVLLSTFILAYWELKFEIMTTALMTTVVFIFLRHTFFSVTTHIKNRGYMKPNAAVGKTTYKFKAAVGDILLYTLTVIIKHRSYSMQVARISKWDHIHSIERVSINFK